MIVSIVKFFNTNSFNISYEAVINEYCIIKFLLSFKAEETDEIGSSCKKISPKICLDQSLTQSWAILLSTCNACVAYMTPSVS